MNQRGFLFLMFAIAGAAPALGAPELLVPEPGPRLAFETGAVVNFKAVVFPDRPPVPGPDSTWQVTQWRKREVLRPEAMTRRDARFADPRLGVPAFSWAAADGESRVSYFRGRQGGVFELEASGGELGPAGGANLFLSADVTRADATFDQPVTLALDLRLSRARASGAAPAIASGAVLAQVFAGFTLRYTDPGDGRVIPVFLQIPLSNSRNDPTPYRGCHRHDGAVEMTEASLAPGEALIPYAAGPARPVALDLNAHLRRLIAAGFTCDEGDGKRRAFVFPAGAREGRNWRVTSMYVGLETEGTVDVAVQVSHLRLIRGR
jgi:hypothetical protein